MNTTLTKKFIDEMKMYQQAQQKYKTDIKNKVKRQVQVIKPDATDEEINDVMKSEGGKDALYKQSILAGGVNDQIKYVVFCYVCLEAFEVLNTHFGSRQPLEPTPCVC